MKIRYDEITNFVEYENETDTEVKTEQYYFDPLDFTTPLPDRIIPDVYTQSGEGLCTLPDECPAKVYVYGNAIEVITSLNRSKGKGLRKIKRIDAEHYKNLETGEVKKYNHRKKGDEPMSTSAFKESVRELKRLVLGNFFNADEGLLLTLEYDEDMPDYSTAQKDYTRFYDNLKYYCKVHFGVKKLLYIKVVDGYVNGSIRFCILIKAKDGTSLLLSEDDLRKLWGQNNVSVKQVTKGGLSGMKGVYGINLLDDKKHVQEQKAFYRKGIRMYSASQELKKAKVITMTQEEAEKKTEGYKRIDKNFSIVRMGKNRNVINMTNYETFIKDGEGLYEQN